MATQHIGKPLNRVDGRQKVTGGAKYAGEFSAENLAYGVVVSSGIAHGKITAIDTAQALAVPGVLKVFTHENRPKLPHSDKSYHDEIAPSGSPFKPLYDAEVKFSQQPIALVVAESFELARYAASLVRVKYESEDHLTDLDKQLDKTIKAEKDSPEPRGNADKAYEKAAVQFEAEYRFSTEHHNPMEPYATTAVREDDGKLTVYDKTQGVQNVHSYLCNVFDLKPTEVRVVSPFVGGAFGSGLRPQYQVLLAVMAARELKRSVRVVLSRQQMFSIGHRPAIWQEISLGATREGKLNAIRHKAIAETSRYEEFVENTVSWSGLLYQCDNVKMTHQLSRLDIHTPSDMRAPGAAWGVCALEIALDELADKLQIDPVELRLLNYAERDQNEDKPFSSKELKECYRQGAEKFGWNRRKAKPGSTREGNTLIGYGMATGVWECMQLEAAAKAEFSPEGKLTVSVATADIGTGTYTIMTQIAAETLGLAISDVAFKLGDSSFPKAPVEGGSFTASTVGSAVKKVSEQLREKVFKIAQSLDNSPLAQVKLADVAFVDGRIVVAKEPTRSLLVKDILRQAKDDTLTAEVEVAPEKSRMKHSCYAHSAVFVEAHVDSDFGTIRIPKVVSAVAAGRIINPKTARSQIMGGIVWGLGMGLTEKTVTDHNLGRFMNHNLAEYHVPVNADVHEIDVIFVEERDEIVNSLGAKGIGEIGLVGVAAAIGNAIYNATGKRIRELPITPDKLL